MTKKSFDYLLEKYLKGNCTPDELKHIDEWFDLVGSDVNIPKNKEEWDLLKHEIWQNIAPKEKIRRFEISKKIIKSTAIAASVVMVLAASFWFVNSKTESFQNFNDDSEIITKVNETEHFQKILLTDGSVVSLAPKAILRYPKSFKTDIREVNLTGKAFFEVFRDVDHPFLVRSKNVITKVLGTSFWIEPQANSESVTVAVVTGKVSVYEDIKISKNNKKEAINNGVIITPNQKVEFLDEEKVFVMGIVDKPKPIIYTKAEVAQYVFDDTPIEVVLATYENNYGLNIEVETENLNKCPITADLNDVPFYTALEIICQSINAKYEIKGTSILISGKGCK